MYQDILKVFTPKVRPTSKSPEKYSDFINELKHFHGIRAKRLYKHNLLKTIESIYSARFFEEKDQFKNSIREKSKFIGENIPFSTFVKHFINEKWKSPRLSSQVF